jgi:ribosomal protein S18 acetylase RimI-like enzyme
MEISIIKDPLDQNSKLIECRVIEYGLTLVNGVTPRNWAIHAIEKDELLGGATGRIHFSQLYIDNIWVKREFRSKGIGTEILNNAVAFTKDQGCRRILLNTLNVKAVKLYQRLGFRTLAVIDDYVDGFNLYYLAREIE